ncbi:2-succinyl-5-enolpyruvyl-6-hydroxy-3-cyclohexene-1-carboxylic-acid synthase [Enterococcus sp. N342-3-1-2]
MSNQEVMTDYLLAAIEGLKAAGAKRAVISPGSRSTPLALLLHRDPDMACFVDVDERSAAFFALGMTKVDGAPTILLCTSGTAAANYYPAICEAEAVNLPLIVLTADRPPELRGVGAPQAMDQQQLYGSHVKKMIEMTVPENQPNMLRYSFWQTASSVTEATKQPKGPVHINFPLREPLLPDFARQSQSQQSFVYMAPIKQLAEATTQSLLPQLQKKGVIVVGESLTIAQAKHLRLFAAKIGWPIIGDPLTNLATCGVEAGTFISQADLVLPKVDDAFQPEVVLRFGRLPVTKNVLLWLNRLPETTTWLFVDPSGQRQDQLQRATYLIETEIDTFAAHWQGHHFKIDQGWVTQWQKVQKIGHQIVAEHFADHPFDESQSVRILQQTLPTDAQILLANSNAIRFFDRFGSETTNAYRVYGNRGVNGIDGLVSTVAGIAMISKKPTYLLIGDLALYHDMNGLQLLRQYHLPVTIILLNNNGGGIFSFLSQNSLAPEDFEPLFGTPLHLDFQKAAALYEADLLLAENIEMFQAQIAASIEQPKFQIIEVRGTQKDPVFLWEECQQLFAEEWSK